MADEPSARVQFNLWAFMLILTTGFMMALTWWGLDAAQLKFSEALAAWAGPVTGGGAVWMYGKVK